MPVFSPLHFDVGFEYEHECFNDHAYASANANANIDGLDSTWAFATSSLI